MIICVFVCVAKAWYSSFLRATELHCCPKTFKIMPMTGHPEAVDDMFLHYYKHGLRSLFGVDATYIILLLEILTTHSLQLKIVPTNEQFTPVWVTFAENASARLFKEIVLHFLKSVFISDLFYLNIYTLGRNKFAYCRVLPTGWGCQKVMTHCWFRPFRGICRQKYKI